MTDSQTFCNRMECKEFGNTWGVSLPLEYSARLGIAAIEDETKPSKSSNLGRLYVC
jgi:hypothetical protein